MGLQPAAVYHKMQDVLRRYELGKLKGQKERLMIGGTFQKALQGKYSFKLSHFKCFQGLFLANKSKKFSGKRSAGKFPAKNNAGNFLVHQMHVSFLQNM